MPTQLSRSRAFWNLRAEQVMDRVFNQEEPALQAVKVRVESSAPQAQQEPVRAQSPEKSQQGLLIGAAGIAVLGIASSLWLGQNWQRSMQALNRERDLQLIERVRNLPITPQSPASKEPTSTGASEPDSKTPTQTNASAAPQLVPLTVPLASPLPMEDSIAAAIPAEPLLVGVVHTGAGQGSAIFQLDQLSLSAAPGEPIGNSGWNLKAVQANGAVIEHAGVERTLSVGGAF